MCRKPKWNMVDSLSLDNETKNSRQIRCPGMVEEGAAHGSAEGPPKYSVGC